MRTRDHRNIKAFAKADDLAVAVYQTTKDWPRDELYGLTSQVRRAAASVAANIAEGSARLTAADFLRFLGIANGSMRETGYLLHLASRLGYVGDADYAALSKQHDEASRVLWGLIESVASGVKDGQFASAVKEDSAEYVLSESDLVTTGPEQYHL